MTSPAEGGTSDAAAQNSLVGNEEVFARLTQTDSRLNQTIVSEDNDSERLAKSSQQCMANSAVASTLPQDLRQLPKTFGAAKMNGDKEHKGVRPKSGKILIRKNTPAVLPKVEKLYSKW